MTTDNIVMWVIQLNTVLDVYETNFSLPQFQTEIISLDAGLRMDGILALASRDVVIEVLHSSKKNRKSSNQETVGNSLHVPSTTLKKNGNQTVDPLSNLDHAATNASSSQCEAHLYFER